MVLCEEKAAEKRVKARGKRVHLLSRLLVLLEVGIDELFQHLRSQFNRGSWPHAANPHHTPTRFKEISDSSPIVKGSKFFEPQQTVAQNDGKFGRNTFRRPAEFYQRRRV
jgi:hypothetical protein